METREIAIDQIRVSEFNTRKDLTAGTEDTGIPDLANSILEQGLINPITVRGTADGRYEIISGQRRFLACQHLGWTTISSIVRNDLSDTAATIISLIENVHRADMNPMDKARAYQGIYEKTGNLQMVAKETGVGTQTVRRYLRLLDLSPSIQDEVTTAEGFKNVETLSKIAQVFEEEDQREALDQIRELSPDIRHRVIQLSDGDLEKIPEMKKQELERANVRICDEGLCHILPDDMKAGILRTLAERGQLG